MRVESAPPVSGIRHAAMARVSGHGRPRRIAELRFLQAVRRRASGDEINERLAELRFEQRLRRDAARVAELATRVAHSELSLIGADDVAQLLSMARLALEELAP